MDRNQWNSKAITTARNHPLAPLSYKISDLFRVASGGCRWLKMMFSGGFNWSAVLVVMAIVFNLCCDNSRMLHIYQIYNKSTVRQGQTFLLAQFNSTILGEDGWITMWVVIVLVKMIFYGMFQNPPHQYFQFHNFLKHTQRKILLLMRLLEQISLILNEFNKLQPHFTTTWKTFDMYLIRHVSLEVHQQRCYPFH